MIPASRWFPFPPLRERDPVLWWLPHSGGTARGVLDWLGDISSGSGSGWSICPVELPGHGTRRSENPYTAMAPLVEDLAAAIVSQQRGGRWAIGGHSLGALVAYETAFRIRALTGEEPTRLIASGCAAPHLIRPDVPPISDADDDTVIEHLRRLGGTPEKVLRSAVFRRRTLPVFRADMRIRESWHYQRYSPMLSMPIAVIIGERDQRATVADAHAWAAQTLWEFNDVHELPGGHFAGQEQPERMRRALRQALGHWPNLATAR